MEREPKLESEQSMPNIEEDIADDARAMQERYSGILNKLGKSPWAKRLTLVIGLLAGGEGMVTAAKAQEQETKEQDPKNRIELSIEEANKHVSIVDEFVRKNADKKGSKRVTGLPPQEAFIKQMGDIRVETSDMRMWLKEVRKNEQGEVSKTLFWLDNDKDGSVDQVVLVGGEVKGHEDTEADLDSYDNDAQLERHLNMSSLDKMGGETPYKNRTVWNFDPETRAVTQYDFNNENAYPFDDPEAVAQIQEWYEAKIATLRAETENK